MNDDQLEFPNSNTDHTVVINGCDSGGLNNDAFNNDAFNNGGNFSDLIGMIIAKNGGDFVSQVTQMATGWGKDGLITAKEKGSIAKCA